MKVNLCNHFTAAAGTAWGPRVLNDWELIHFSDGRAVYEYESCAIEFRPGRLLAIPPGERHTLTCRRAVTLACIHLEPDGGLPPLPRLIRLDPGEDHRLGETFRACAGEFTGAAAGRERLLALMIAEVWHRAVRAASGGVQAPSPLLQAMLDWIESRPSEAITRRSLAERFGVTPEHVNFCFRRELGSTPSHYVNRRRIYHAYRLLAAGCRSVKEAAALAGFSDQYYFGRLFKSVTGATPGSVRTASAVHRGE